MNSILKAIYGGVTAGVAALGTLLASNGGHMTAVGWVGVVSAVLATFGSVYGVTNIPPGSPAP